MRRRTRLCFCWCTRELCLGSHCRQPWRRNGKKTKCNTRELLKPFSLPTRVQIYPETRATLNTPPLLSSGKGRQGSFWTRCVNFKKCSSLLCYINKSWPHSILRNSDKKVLAQIERSPASAAALYLRCLTRPDLAGNHLKCFMAQDNRRVLFFQKTTTNEALEFQPITISGSSGREGTGIRETERTIETLLHILSLHTYFTSQLIILVTILLSVWDFNVLPTIKSIDRLPFFFFYFHMIWKL